MTVFASRREVLTGLAGVAAVAGAGSTPARAAGLPFGLGPRSGLPWHSGASLSSVNAIAAYRNRLCDTLTMWCRFDTWDTIIDFSKGFKSAKLKPERISCAIAPLPKICSAVITPGMWWWYVGGILVGALSGFILTYLFGFKESMESRLD